jgi:glutathione S-transferase
VDSGYSIVDPYLLVFYRWGQLLGFDLPRRCPAWTRLTYALLDRPAVDRALQREGVAIF